jgi:hypothetical protein
MKHKLLKSFLFLAMLALVGNPHSLMHASEVTGTLSSTGEGSQQEQPSNTGAHSSSPEATEPPDNGIIAGSVTDGTNQTSGGSGGGGNGDGNVLGDSTKNTIVVESSPNYLSSDGNKVVPSQRAQTVDNGTSVSEDTILPPRFDKPSTNNIYGSSPQVATALGALSQFNTVSWFLIIALSLFLISVIVYIYNNRKAKTVSKTVRLNL